MRGRSLVALIAPVLIAAAVGCGSSASTASNRSAMPHELAQLLERMERLVLHSERYLQSTRLQTLATGSGGEGFDSYRGEVSLPRAASETFRTDPAMTPVGLTIGRTRYSYSLELARCDGGRPWLREQDGAPRASFPFQGAPGESPSSGIDAYAGLIKLIATASGPIRTLGQVTVDGQPTTEFAATVDPARLLNGLSEKQLRDMVLGNEDLLIAQVKPRSVPTELHAYIAASGIPVRVVTSARFGPYRSDTETTDVLSINDPVGPMRPPPAGRTVGIREAAGLFRRLSGKCAIRIFEG